MGARMGARVLNRSLVKVEADELRPAAMTLAREIAENAPLAVMSVRATMREGLADAVAAATDHELKIHYTHHHGYWS